MKLISYSYNEEKTLEEQVTYCARVSNPTSQENNLNNPQLIAYLMKHGHWSPFEMVSICLEIETTRHCSTNSAASVFFFPRVLATICRTQSGFDQARCSNSRHQESSEQYRN